MYSRQNIIIIFRVGVICVLRVAWWWFPSLNDHQLFEAFLCGGCMLTGDSKLSVGMNGCVSVSPCYKLVSLSSVHPDSFPVAAGIDSSPRIGCVSGRRLMDALSVLEVLVL